MKYTHVFALLGALAGCSGGSDSVDTGGPAVVPGTPSVVPATPQQRAVGEGVVFVASGLDDTQAYRITLVVDANLTPVGDGTGTFVDGDGDGTADAGLSEEIALISGVNGVDIDNSKTVPAGTDDPAAPSGMFPVDGKIMFTVRGVSSGTVHPVVYVNGGASTFLEVDPATGTPSELHALGGSVTVTGEAVPEEMGVSPSGDQTLEVDDTTTYTISGVDDAQAYRITFVLADNMTAAGDGTATFVDADANGAADSGTSELVANIVSVNGEDVDGTKTVPSAEDDPAAPSGVYPEGGEITLDVIGLAPGRVYPVAYVNGGASTFLELDASGDPIETYTVGGLLEVE